MTYLNSELIPVNSPDSQVESICYSSSLIINYTWVAMASDHTVMELLFFASCACMQRYGNRRLLPGAKTGERGKKWLDATATLVVG